MDTRLVRILAALGLAILVAGPAALAEPAQAPSPAERDQLEAELDQARAQLDSAAEKLAALHQKMYAMETTGEQGQKPMLGVLLGERGPTGGIVLVGVTPGGGAEAAGLRAGDELTSANGVDLTGSKPLTVLKEAMQGVAPGDVVPVGYQRNGSVAAADITTQARGVFIMGMTGAPHVRVDVDGLDAMADTVTDGQWVQNLESLEHLKALGPAVMGAVHVGGLPGGLRLEDISADLGHYFGVESGVLVLAAPEVADGDPPGLKAGDILLAVNGSPVASAGEGYGALLAPLEPGEDSVGVEVLRDGVRESVTVVPRAAGTGPHTITIRKGDLDDLDIRVISPESPTPPEPPATR
ncbi:MAG: PDZ domain-containing protein [Pseudomonadales bacterium]|jgi:S1-C subfamily serine protease